MSDITWVLDVTVRLTAEQHLLTGGDRFQQWQKKFDSAEDAEKWKDEKIAECNRLGQGHNISGPVPDHSQCDSWEDW